MKKFGPGRIDGKDMYPILSYDPFNKGYADTQWIRIHAVSVLNMYPTRDTRLHWRIRVSEPVTVLQNIDPKPKRHSLWYPANLPILDSSLYNSRK